MSGLAPEDQIVQCVNLGLRDSLKPELDERACPLSPGLPVEILDVCRGGSTYSISRALFGKEREHVPLKGHEHVNSKHGSMTFVAGNVWPVLSTKMQISSNSYVYISTTGILLPLILNPLPRQKPLD